MQGSETHKIDRKTAGELLHVSIRTVDRYIKNGRLSTQTRNGKKWLSETEIEAFITRRDAPPYPAHTPIPQNKDNQDNSERPTPALSTLSTESPKTQPESEEIYKSLYAELKQEIKTQQERLEGANYRVGQLETQLQNTVPLLEYHQENQERKKEHDELRENIKIYESALTEVKTEIKDEKITKRIYLSILLFILILQPLWLWLSNMH